MLGLDKRMDFLDNKVWKVFDFESQDSAWRMSLHLNSDSRAYSTQRAISGSQCLSGFCRESQRLSGFCSRSQPLSGFCQRVSICKHSARGDSVCQDSAQRASICQDSAREPVFVSIRLGETALRVKVFY